MSYSAEEFHKVYMEICSLIFNELHDGHGNKFDSELIGKVLMRLTVEIFVDNGIERKEFLKLFEKIWGRCEDFNKIIYGHK